MPVRFTASLEERSWSDGGWELGAEAGGAHPGAVCGYGKRTNISAFGILWLNEKSGGSALQHKGSAVVPWGFCSLPVFGLCGEKILTFCR